LRVRLGAFVAVVASLALAWPGQASAATWRHPKADAWLAQHARHVGALLSDAQIVYGEMQPCSSTNGPDPGSSLPCAGLSGDPGDWAMRTGLDCPKVTTDVRTLQSDGPIPLAQAQRWWSTALEDLTLGCHAIEQAQRAWLANSPVGEHTSASEPGDVAAAYMQTANMLLRRVSTTVSATRK
jgi:hypothetical protein